MTPRQYYSAVSSRTTMHDKMVSSTVSTVETFHLTSPGRWIFIGKPGLGALVSDVLGEMYVSNLVRVSIGHRLEHSATLCSFSATNPTVDFPLAYEHNVNSYGNR